MESTKNNTLPLDRMGQLEAYSMAWSTPVSEAVRAQVAKATASLAYVDMASGPMMRGLLGFLVRAMKAQRVLEIGTFIGTSAMVMAEAMHEVQGFQDSFAPQTPHHNTPYHFTPHLLTIDKNKRYIELVKGPFSQEPYASIIESVEGDALAMLKAGDPRVASTQPWDLLFLDGDKAHYPEYIEYVVELIRVGGVLVIDNVLWYGHVLDAETLATEKRDSDTFATNDDVRQPHTTRDVKHKQKAVAIDKMNQMLAQDPRLSTQILPFGDGVTLATRIQ
ncbi:MAG: class I SAM-dependent methyltransferase [Balneolaceae bacterium]|nr:class I SAM-dependent methyltransferase [Balneolaceae bacterium]